MNTEKGTQNKLSKFLEFFLQEHIQEIQKQAQVLVEDGAKAQPCTSGVTTNRD